MPPSKIRPIAICVFRHDNQILVFEGFDSVKQAHYYRPLGGGIEPGERAVETIRREIREEISQETDHFRMLGVIENIFELEGRPKHEIVFVFDGAFLDRGAYEVEHTVSEPNGLTYAARWRSLDRFDDKHLLVPGGLMDLVRSA